MRNDERERTAHVAGVRGRVERENALLGVGAERVVVALVLNAEENARSLLRTEWVM